MFEKIKRGYWFLRALMYLPIYKIRNRQKEFRYNLSVAMTVKDEGLYLQEFIEYHKMMGVEHFYIYNNNGTDNTADILKPYMDARLVTYQDFPGIGVQQKIYAHACKRCRTETKWLAIIDADEFILPLEHENIPEFLKDYEDFSQICIHWLRYGSSGHKEKPSGLVVENFTQHEECGNQHVKSIVNPRAVVKTRIHWHEVSGKSVNENKDRVTGPKDVRAPISKIRINHYLVKSFEECEIKRLRGRNNGMLRNITYFQWYDKNDVADGRMAPHAERLKKLITWRNKGGA